MKQRFSPPFRQANKRELTTAAMIVCILLAALGILATYILVHSVDTNQNRDYQDKQSRELRTTANYSRAKIANYSQVLLSAAAAVNVKGSDNISATDWSTVYQTSHIAKSFPEILALGYVKLVNADQVDSFLQYTQPQSTTNFSIYPAGSRSQYAPVTYIEPFNEINQRAYGFDMLTEANREGAMGGARDTGSFSITSPLVLKQDDTEDNSVKPRSILLYYPIFQGGNVPTALSDRQKSISGYVYLAVRIADMVSARNQELKGQSVSYNFRDISGDGSTFYTFPERMMQAERDETATSTISVANHRWVVTMTMLRPHRAWTNTPFGLFLIGTGASMLLASAAYVLLRVRIQGVRNRHENELQGTRNELLALASHQLRTPASGVKQYIGMLKQGFFGDLNTEQTAIAEKAYRSNDRQLEIIDQLLYVAKADAGQLVVQQGRFDIARATRDIIDGMTEVTNTKEIIIKPTIPGSLEMIGDERFIRMIIENLLSNAIKYSYPRGKISIRLTSVYGLVKLIIADKGVGIADEDIDKLFKKFSRIPNPLSRKEGGSGLGLYLAYRLAAAHGGDIEVTSREGRGSRFVLTLPKQYLTEQSIIQLGE